MGNEKIVTAIDVGTSKIVALVAILHSETEIELIGIGVASSSGVKSGAVTNMEQVSRGIKEAIEEAELMSGAEIQSAIINITGKHVRGDNSTGVIAITNRDRIVTHSEIYRVIDAAQAIRIPADQEIIHVLSREFKVDDQDAIRDPMGMVGVRLEADVHIVTASLTQIQNTQKVLNQAGIEIRDRILSSLASSAAILNESEKDLGVAIADIGDGVIDLIIYVKGGVAFTSTICLGGFHLTQDITIGLKTPMESAELLKKRHGYAESNGIDPAEMIEVPSVGERSPRVIPRSELVEIMEARLREILELIDHELMKSGYKSVLAGGIIFTGGGSMIEGLPNLAEEIIGLSASIGHPRGTTGIGDKISSPIFATSVGLIHYWAKYNDLGKDKRQSLGILEKIKFWIQKNL